MKANPLQSCLEARPIVRHTLHMSTSTFAAKIRRIACGVARMSVIPTLGVVVVAVAGCGGSDSSTVTGGAYQLDLKYSDSLRDPQTNMLVIPSDLALKVDSQADVVHFSSTQMETVTIPIESWSTRTECPTQFGGVWVDVIHLDVNPLQLGGVRIDAPLIVADCGDENGNAETVELVPDGFNDGVDLEEQPSASHRLVFRIAVGPVDE